jgi:hypothetical protein
VRDAIDAILGVEYEQALTLLSRLRQRLRDAALPADERQRLFTALVHSELLDCLRAGDTAAADRVLARLAGAETTLASLGLTPTDSAHSVSGLDRGS